MKAQTLLPWICVAGLAAGAVVLFVSGKNKDIELIHLREENSETQTLRTEIEETRKQIEVQSNELTALRQNQSDLLQLRNKNRQLQQEKDQLSRQVETAQGEAQRAQAQVTQAARTVQASAQQQVQQLQAENQQLRTQTTQSQAANLLNACINNLRQLDGAKQQWALENGKNAESVPQPQDILPYVGRGPTPALPTCPGGGTYTLNAVGQEPTCSIPGHALPKFK